MTAMGKKILFAAGLLIIVVILIVQRAPQATRSLSILNRSGSVTLDTSRGGTLSTGADGELTFTLDGVTVQMTANTDVRLDRLFKDEVALFVPRGQVTITRSMDDRGSLDVSSDRVTGRADPGEAFTFINYDFQERISVIPLSGSIDVFVNNAFASTLTAENEKYIDLSELAPYGITELKIK